MLKKGFARFEPGSLDSKSKVLTKLHHGPSIFKAEYTTHFLNRKEN